MADQLVKIPMHQKIKALALCLLARREHSRFELKRKLLLHQFDHTLIDTVLDELQSKQWQDDARFAESYIRNRIEQGDGPVKIQYNLYARGVATALITDTLPTDFDFWIEQIQRKWHKKCILSDRASKAKTSRFLQSRGFTLDQIKRYFMQQP